MVGMGAHIILDSVVFREGLAEKLTSEKLG